MEAQLNWTVKPLHLTYYTDRESSRFYKVFVFWVVWHILPNISDCQKHFGGWYMTTTRRMEALKSLRNPLPCNNKMQETIINNMKDFQISYKNYLGGS